MLGAIFEQDFKVVVAQGFDLLDGQFFAFLDRIQQIRFCMDAFRLADEGRRRNGTAGLTAGGNPALNFRFLLSAKVLRVQPIGIQRCDEQVGGVLIRADIAVEGVQLQRLVRVEMEPRRIFMLQFVFWRHDIEEQPVVRLDEQDGAAVADLQL